MAASNTSNENSFRSFITSLDRPIVLKGHLNAPEIKRKWDCMNWELREWSKVFGETEYQAHFGQKLSPSALQDFPQWEYLNLRSDMSYRDLIKYSNNKIPWTTDCMSNVNIIDYWAYIDYLRTEKLANISSLDDFMDWNIFGLREIEPKDCRIWVGTEGANTPLHIDTYGINIVCQMYGKKRWTLFPKSQTPYLYSTRIPFEESSIYSEIGFPKPNLVKFSKMMHTTPYLVTLEKGDVLIVPKHWWHFVESLDFSIALNTWIPLNSDGDDKLKEGLITYEIACLCHGLTSASLVKSIYHSDMLEFAFLEPNEIMEILKVRVKEYIRTKGPDSPVKDKSCFSLPSNGQEVSKFTIQDYCAIVGININNLDFSKSPLYNNDLDSQCNFIKVLLNAFTDDRVIEVVKTVFKEKLNID